MRRLTGFVCEFDFGNQIENLRTSRRIYFCLLEHINNVGLDSNKALYELMKHFCKVGAITDSMIGNSSDLEWRRNELSSHQTEKINITTCAQRIPLLIECIKKY